MTRLLTGRSLVPYARGAMVRHSATQTTSATPGTDLILTWNTVLWDTGGFYSAGAPTLLTAQLAGIYEIGSNIKWESDVNGTREVILETSAGANLGIISQWPAPAGSTRQQLSGLHLLAAGTSVRVAVLAGIASQDVQVEGTFTPRFWMLFVSPL